MAGRRLREAVKETLVSNGNGEFDDDTHIVIAGLTNTYSQYIATFEEYKQQRYEVYAIILAMYYTRNSISSCSLTGFILQDIMHRRIKRSHQQSFWHKQKSYPWGSARGFSFL